MERSHLVKLVRYHARSNERILDTIGSLQTGDVERPSDLDHGSIAETLRHLVVVDNSWREFLLGHDVDEPYDWEVPPLPDLASMRSFWIEETNRLEAFVQALGSDDVDRPYSWTNEGAGVTASLSLIVAHIVNHGTGIAASWRAT